MSTELLCDSDYDRLHKIRKDIEAAEKVREYMPPSTLLWLDDAKFLMACLSEARDLLWAIEH